MGGDDQCHVVQKWLTTGVCAFKSAVASDIIRELQENAAWFSTSTALLPVSIPGNLEAQPPMSAPTRLLLSVLEHFRSAIFPQRPDGWTERLPRLTYTDEELKTISTDQQQRDELAVIAQLARLGSVSSLITTYFGLTRSVIQEALDTLRDERKAQCNLPEILSA